MKSESCQNTDKLRVSPKNGAIKNLQYALRICKCPQIPGFNTENFITTIYGGRAIYRLSGNGKGVRAQHPHIGLYYSRLEYVSCTFCLENPADGLWRLHHVLSAHQAGGHKMLGHVIIASRVNDGPRTLKRKNQKNHRPLDAFVICLFPFSKNQ